MFSFYMHGYFKIAHYIERICLIKFYRNWRNQIWKFYVIYDLNRTWIDRGSRMHQTPSAHSHTFTHIPTLLPHFLSDS